MRSSPTLYVLLGLLAVAAALLLGTRAAREPVPAVQQQAQQPQRTPLVTVISAAGTFMAVRRDDGTIWTWGRVGQDNGPFSLFGGVPTPYNGATGASAGIAGPNKLLVLKTDGTLWEAKGFRNAPLVQKLTAVSSAADGGKHAVALRTDGTVWTWGENGFGQLGRGMKDDGTEPGAVTDIKGVPLAGMAAVAAGGGHTVALGRDGSVRVWGANGSGQLGVGSLSDQGVPTLVEGLSDITAVACGYAHTIAAARDGSVWTWGANDSGQLGDGTRKQQARPVRVAGLSDIIAVAAGRQHSAALRRDGTVWAWGSNNRGQLGQIDLPSSRTPVQVPDLAGITSLSCGYDHTAALATDGTVWVWGDNRQCQLGDGNKAHRTMPVPVTALSGTSVRRTDEYAATRFERPVGASVPAFPASPTAVAAGGYHSLALDQAGTVWAWGRNNAGQLGDGTTSGSGIAVPVAGLSDVAAVDGGGYHTAAVTKQGTVWTWGSNQYGQLGDGAYQSSSRPVLVKGLDAAAAVSAGWAHTVALERDGTVWAWGNNDQGQLGDGSTMGSAVPVRVAGLDGVSAISAGRYHTMALRKDGTLWAWGANDADQLGPGIAGGSNAPVQVKAAGAVFAAAACDHHTLTLVKWNGRVLAWGGNEYGQLGNGVITAPMPEAGQDAGRLDIRITTTAEERPSLERYEVKRLDRAAVPGGAGDGSLRSVVAVACGGDHGLALDHGGALAVWGRGNNGQLGSSGRPWEGSGLALPLARGVAGMAAGQEHTVVLFSNGTVHAWGSNEFGQLGSGQRDDAWSRTTQVR